MQTKLKNVLSFSNKLILLIILNFNFCFSQEMKFELKNNKFKILNNNNLIYSDSINFFKGSCNDLQIIKSNFSNQFYFYTENNCTTKVIKELYKIMWYKQKFTILSKEYFEVYQNKINSKITYYNNFTIDSLKIDLLETEEKINEITESKIPIYFNNKIIGYKRKSKNDIINNYPIIDNYNIIESANLYNNIAFAFFKNGAYDESIFILNKVIEKFPACSVSYLNIADCYWVLNQKQNSKVNYQKYIQLMKKQKKDLKTIPKYVYNRLNTN